MSHSLWDNFPGATSPMAVAAYTYDQLSPGARALVPAEDQITAAFDALPDEPADTD